MTSLRYLFFLITLLSFSASNAANERIALIIGNANYADLGSLSNTLNDAKGINKSLSEMGYKTKLVLNANEATTRKEIRTFASESEGASIALVFYAGHGAQVGGENYLLPVDIEVPKRESDIQLSAIKVDDIINSLKSKTKVIFLDACRDNPALLKSLSKGRGAYRGGLAPAKNASYDDQGVGIFIAYATDSGNVALDTVGQSNSPFTTALLRHIKDPISIDDMFSMVTKEVRQQTQNNQRPYKYASLNGIVCLPGSCSKVMPPPSREIVQQDSQQIQPLSSQPKLLPDSWILFNNQLPPNKSLVYINPSSIRREGSRVSFKSKWVTPKESAFAFLGGKVGYKVITYVIDCKSYKSNVLELDEYDSNDKKLEGFRYGNINTLALTSDYSSPESLGYASGQLACNPDRFTPIANQTPIESDDWERFFSLANGVELYYAKSSLKKDTTPQVTTKVTFKRVDISKLRDSIGIATGYESFDTSAPVASLVSQNVFLCKEETSYQILENYYDQDGSLTAYSSYQDLPPSFFKSLVKNNPESPLGQLSRLVCP